MKQNIFIFIGLSALIHIIFIGIYHKWETENSGIQEPSSSFTYIELTSQITNNSKQQNTPQSTLNKKNLTSIESPKNRPLTKPSKKIIFSEQKTKTPPKNKKTSSIKTKSYTALIKEPSTMNRLTSIEDNKIKIYTLLNSELAKYFHYPRLAIRKHYQGKVTLSFKVNSQGKIINILIQESSGYNILDTAAINSVKKIDLYTELKTLNDNNTSTITLPVTYNLDQLP